MSRTALEFLTDSPLWSSEEQEAAFARLSDDDLKRQLAAYRAHILENEIKAARGLSVAVSARQRRLPNQREVKQSVLYFEEVLLPDPVFELTEWTRDRDTLPAESRDVPRTSLVSAVRYVQELVPLVRIGRVRFVPTSRILEPPERLKILYPDDAFESLVPEPLRAWFRERAVVRKVVIDLEGQRRLVMSKGPDVDTSSIMVDFGQAGPKMTYDHYHVIGATDDRMIWTRIEPPDDDAAMGRWLLQSTNKSAAEYLRTVVADVGVAAKLGCSLVTSCPVTGELLDQLSAPHAARRADYSSALTLQLPMLATASTEQLAELIQAEGAAFEALRIELRAVVESLAFIEDESARKVEAQFASARLAREQVHEIDRKLHESRGALKYGLPVTAAVLAAAGLGFVATGGIAAGLAALFTGAAAVGVALKEHNAPRALPGYFLWKLKKGADDEARHLPSTATKALAKATDHEDPESRRPPTSLEERRS